MKFEFVSDLRNTNIVKKRNPDYIMYDDTHHDLYLVYKDGSRINYIQNDFPIEKIEILAGDDLATAEAVLTMNEANKLYEIPSEISWLKWTVIRADRKR